ncbi:MAG: PAS domain-containing protein [Rhodopila sp.]
MTFRTPGIALGAIDAEAAAALVSAAADIALILDPGGVIKDVSISDKSLADELPGHAGWMGKSWVEIVTEESRPKVEQILAEALAGTDSRWRHLNHPPSPRPMRLLAAVQISRSCTQWCLPARVSDW